MIDRDVSNPASAGGDAVQVLEVEGTTSKILFVVGQPLPPFAIGRAGPLAFEGANDLLDAHAFLHFDGQALFACSTTAAMPVVVDGNDLPRHWTRLHAPCTLSMGSARLVFRHERREPALEDAALRPRNEGPRPLETTPARAAMPRRSRGWLVMACGVSTLALAAVAAARFLALPGTVWGAAPTAPTSPITLVAGADEGGASPPVNSAVVVYPAPPRRLAPPPSGAPAARRDAGPAPRSLEREAVDAVRAGDRERALAVYRQLAQARPDHPAFAQAARIIATSAAP